VLRTDILLRGCQFSFKSHFFRLLKDFFKPIWLANTQKNYLSQDNGFDSLRSRKFKSIFSVKAQMDPTCKLSSKCLRLHHLKFGSSNILQWRKWTTSSKESSTGYNAVILGLMVAGGGNSTNSKGQSSQKHKPLKTTQLIITTLIQLSKVTTDLRSHSTCQQSLI